MPITTLSDVKQLGKILCVFAHPDDETFTMGGLLAAAAANGQTIAIITATKGEGGVQDESRWPADQLGDIRAGELRAALDQLGVEQQHFLGYQDGTCKDSDAETAAQELAEYIARYQPDSIFTFGPDGLTGHPDHRTVSAWTSKALKRAASHAKLYHVVLTPGQYHGFREVDADFNFFFNTEKPPVYESHDASICVTLSDEFFGRKMAALAAMPSQYDAVFRRFSKEDLRGGFGIEAFVEG